MREVGQTAGEGIQSEYHLALDQTRGNPRVVVTRSIKSRGYAVFNSVDRVPVPEDYYQGIDRRRQKRQNLPN